MAAKYHSIQDIRAEFPALQQKVYGKPLVYLDNGATSQKPRAVLSVLQEMESGLNGNIHRAVHYLSAKCTERYEEARLKIKDFIGAEEEKDIIFTAGTTASINLLASSFGEAFVHPGDKIVISRSEHHSNMVPWQILCQRKSARLEVLEVDEDGNLCLEDLPKLLDGAKILAITQVSNVLGLVNPIKEVIDAAHLQGVPVLVDGAQGIVHRPINVKETDVDFYAFSGHKIYGPTGIGVLYGKRKFLEQMPPWQSGGDMIASVSLSKGTTYAPLPMKFEAGTANYIGAAALGAAIGFMQDIDSQWMASHEDALTAKGLELLGAIDGLHIYGLPSKVAKVPLFSFNIDGVHPNDLALLLDQAGIALRSGQLCAEPLLERYGQNAVLRASLGIYNTIEEIEYLADRLRWAVKLLR